MKTSVRVLSMALLLLLPLAAEAAEWRVIGKDSRLGFRGTQAGAAFDGVFPAYDAKISFDPEHLETSKVVVTIELAKADSGSTERDSALRQQDWFHVEKFPTASFQSAKIIKVGTDRYEAQGTLTLKGIKRPLVLPFSLKIAGAAAHMTGQVTLNRHDFNVGAGQWVSDQWVGKDVVVTVKLAAVRQ